MSSDSHCLHKEPCPKCDSRDNLGRYSDGHGYCFGCGYYEHAPGEESEAPPSYASKGKRMASKEMLQGEVEELKVRGISLETCQKFNYVCGKDGKRSAQIANYYDPSGKRVVAQKVRYKGKDFRVTGDLKEAGLYGQWLWRDRGKRVVVVEGEIDCLTVSQLQGNKWPVVSVPNGAQGAKKALSEQLDWLLGFEEVVLFFDNDEPGKDAALECAPLFPPGRVKIARLAEYKDANEALLAGDGDKVIPAVWDAKEFRPDGIVTVRDVFDAATKPAQMGLSWPWPALTKMTYGRRRKEVITWGAGTGVGKTDVLTQSIGHLLDVHQLPVAAFYLETPPSELVQRVAGKQNAKRFHVPDAGWTREELVAAVEKLDKQNLLYIYDNFGQCDWDIIKTHIRYLAAAKGVKDIVLDHLTALAATGDGERGSIENIMREVAGLAHELDLTIDVVSHLSTPEGTPHEEGGRVMIRHFKGSRAIGYWSNLMFGLERNNQHEDDEWRRTTTVRCLKERLTGSTGQVFYLGFDAETGVLNEREPPADEKPFRDETRSAGDTDLGDDPF